MKLCASLVTDNTINALLQVNALVEEYCRSNHAQSELEQTLLLVCEEVFANIVNHGYCEPGEHTIEIKVYHDALQVMIEFKDDGLAFNPLQQQAPQLGLPVAEAPVGGLGLTLIRQLSDDLNYHRQGNYNILSLHWNKQQQTGQDQ
jgi:anti-sigma regulatory factor (Ser/Thr protein kinase)